MRSANISVHLTEADAIQIWRRRLNGEAQHVLAADFNVNPGRIAEVLSGRRFPNARAFALAQNPDLNPERIENILQGALPLDAEDDAQHD
ncbi:MAG TPA: hypothetical protein VME41_18230 [Stellaceae bacterium]|nr:hypothetical protein [Stellaceae bacterium]